MYIRWKRRKGKRTIHLEDAPRDTWSASLVENKRIDGKPTQRVVKYLGSFQERLRGPQWIHLQHEFWQKITSQLDVFDLPHAQRQHIETQIANVVTHPTPQEADRHWTNLLEHRAASGCQKSRQELEARCSVQKTA